MLSATFKMQYDQCRKEYNALAFEQGVNSRCLSAIKAKITCWDSQTEQEAKAFYKEKASGGDANEKAAKAAYGSESDYVKSQLKAQHQKGEYRELAAYDAMYETRKDTIAEELSDLEEEMKLFQEQHTKGIQEQTTFACFGGG